MIGLVNSKKYHLFAIIICLVFVLLGLFSVEGFDWKNLKYSGIAITADENSHIPAGYYYLKTGKYFINPEHPPLMKDISALPLLLLNPTLPNISDSKELYANYLKNKANLTGFELPKNLEIENYQWSWGYIFLFNPDNNPDVIAFWSRLSVIFFNAIFLFLFYYFISKLWDRRASLAALFLIAIPQFNIAHGSLVTMDFMSAVLQIIAIACFCLYMKSFVAGRKDFKYFFICVLFLSLALLSKFSSIILIPTLFLGGFIHVFFPKNPRKSIWIYLLRYSTILISTFIFISFFYYFHIRNMDNADMIRQLVYNYPKGLPWWGVELLSSLTIGNPITKGLAEYISGLLLVVGRMDLADQVNYFMGRFYGAEGAGISYFPILYLTKTPMAILLLGVISLILGLFTLFRKREGFEYNFRLFSSKIFNLTLFLFVYFYAVTTLSSNLQIGLRHILPIMFAISLFIARTMDIFWEKEKWKFIKIKYIFTIASIWLIISTIVTFPFYLSYYNYFGGGTEKGYEIATDSNYDWGQDVKLLAKWVRENNIREIYTDVTTKIPLDYYFEDGRVAHNFDIEWWGLPETKPCYIAVSMFEYQNNIYDSKIPADKKYTILKDNLIAKIGTTILVFMIPDGSDTNN
jgi:4-amino-4-deoxy-L-arabinose transferase-like glycosyltransferase